MPLPHGDSAVNDDLNSVVDDPIDDRLRDRGVSRRADRLVPAFGRILCTQYQGTAMDPGFDDLEKIVRLLLGQASDQPFVHDEEVGFLDQVQISV